jgi:YebC/PmpR family DNA-binding regulatory protein
MSGHSKWATIKHSKGKADAARGKIFNRLIREITVAAKMGGGIPENNPRLRSAIASARGQNMPGKNIENAILKGTGQLEGVVYEEFTLEGYALGGVAVLIECMSDNRNRTVSEVRHTMTKAGGNLAAVNSVAYQFHIRGFIQVPKSAADEDKLMEIALEAGADDMSAEGDSFEITTAPDTFENVRKAIEQAGITIGSAELTKVADTNVALEGEAAGKVLRLIDALDDLDDTQHVYANFDVSEETLKKFSEE